MEIKGEELTIAIIPARKGSTGLPNKNLRNFGRKNLIQIAVESALGSKIFDQCILTTDYSKNELGKLDSSLVVLSRSERASSNESSANHVLEDVFKKLSSDLLDLDPVIVYLQPTSVLRRTIQIIDAVKLHRDSKYMPVVSVCSHEIQKGKLLRLGALGLLTTLESESAASSNRTSENSYFYPNGAIYVFRYSDFKKRGTFPIESTLPYMMDWISSIDIDTEDEFISAEEIWRKTHAEF